MSEMSSLERRYRRLLAVFPVDHRRAHGEEMVGVLLAGARDGQRRPGLAEAADLVRGALRIRGRRLARGSADPRWRDALAVVSVAAPLLLLATGLVGNDIIGVAIRAVGGSPENPFWLSYWSVWPATFGAAALVALVLLRLRRTAALAALAVTVSGVTMRVWTVPAFLQSPGVVLWLYTGGLATAALAFSPGPRRGLEILGWWRTALIGVGALALGALAWGDPAFTVPVPGPNLHIVLLAAPVAVAALCVRTPVGRRAIALLAIPAIPFAYWTLALVTNQAIWVGGGAAQLAILYLPPVLILCLVVVAIRRDRHRAARGGGGPPTGQDAET